MVNAKDSLLLLRFEKYCCLHLLQFFFSNNISLKVLTDPPVLFCDEPTTGLDTFSAERLVTMLKDLTLRGKTVVCTIHQPSSEAFALFDRLVLLAEGRIAYQGSSTGALTFFER